MTGLLYDTEDLEELMLVSEDEEEALAAIDDRLEVGQLDPARAREETSENVGHLARLIRELEGAEKTLMEESARLRERAATRARRVEWLRAWMKRAMESVELDKVTEPGFTVSLARSAPQLDIEDVRDVPEEWLTVHASLPAPDLPAELRGRSELSYTVRRRELLAHIKETGEIVEGAPLAPETKHLAIRW